MPFFCTRFSLGVLLMTGAALPLAAQSASNSPQSSGAAATATANTLAPVADALGNRRWNWGAFFTGGNSVSTSPSARILNVGVRAGKVMTAPFGPGFLRGQFEYSAELMPWWQGSTQQFERFNLTATSNPNVAAFAGPYLTGGAYNGVSLTPIILRWDLESGSRRLLPFLQGGGGLIWTNHKFPPVGPYPEPGHQGTSVWNFTPQFGIGFQYFLKPRRSITFNANAVHISNASLGDANPGLNATVQFQIGYSWWK